MARQIVSVVVTYDVSRAKTRRKVAKLLEKSMVRVQKSVFEGRFDVRVAERLFDAVEAILDDGDSLRMYVMSRSGLRRSRVAGGCPLMEDGAFWLL